MIISKENKVIVFLVPKTGTYFLYDLFHRNKDVAKISHHVHNHGTWDRLKASEEDDGISVDEYRCFAFYREPIDRAISIVNYLRRGQQLSKFYHAFYGDKYPITGSRRKNYYHLSPEMKAINDSVPFMEVFKKFKWYFERGAYGRTQKKWLDFPTIELLNFHDYDNELDRLLHAFNLNPASIKRDKVNESIYIPELDTLTAEEMVELKDYFKEDYDFFASKSIKFKI